MEQIVIVDHGPMQRFPDEHALHVYKLVDHRVVGQLFCRLFSRGLRDESGQRHYPPAGIACCGQHRYLPHGDEQPLSPPLRVLVEFAQVSELHVRRRFGHEMMYELERRWPDVLCTRPIDNGNQSIPSWYALRAEIMRAGDPHFGRDDLPPYEPMPL